MDSTRFATRFGTRYPIRVVGLNGKRKLNGGVRITFGQTSSRISSREELRPSTTIMTTTFDRVLSRFLIEIRRHNRYRKSREEKIDKRSRPAMSLSNGLRVTMGEGGLRDAETRGHGIGERGSGSLFRRELKSIRRFGGLTAGRAHGRP